MTRCLQLAALGAGHVAPNPMVGAVLVHGGNIIGEGFHQRYGQPHAEVHCINSVTPENQHKIPHAILYVSLEPCNHFGKTPPCADLIIRHQIKEVVIACRDASEKVNGRGVQKLLDAGISVHEGVLGREAMALNKRFFCVQQKNRPYIFLKWAETDNGFIAADDCAPLAISNAFSNRITHRMRAEESAILVGTKTAMTDNPSLTTRLWPGPNPLRIVIDKYLQLPLTHKLYDGEAQTLIVNLQKDEIRGNVEYFKVTSEAEMIPLLMEKLMTAGISSLIVEGGAKTLQHFIDLNCWNEALVITNTSTCIAAGIRSPLLSNNVKLAESMIFNDRHSVYINPHSCSFS